MVGFLLFGIMVVVFTVVFVTDASCGISHKEKSAIITRAILSCNCCVCIILSDLLFARFYHDLA